MKLYEQIKNHTKKSFIARLDDTGKPLKNVANYGLQVGSVAKRMGKGEYTDFSVKVLDQVYPLFTNITVLRAIKYLDDGDIMVAGDILGLKKDMQEYGINIIYWALSVWLEKNELFIPPSYKKEYIMDDKLEKLKDRILTVRSRPLNVKLRIESIGKSKKGHSVVPENWLGKTFDNAYELHSEMDKLDWRKGKAPVHYCCIHSMAIVDTNTWTSIDFNKTDYDKIIYLSFKKGQLLTKYDNKNNNYKMMSINFPLQTEKGKHDKILFVADLDSLVDNNPQYERYETVGVLVSRLQKCIRRGRKCPRALIETIVRLSTSPPYNLPDQQFLKVSGCRQLCWRLFISIIEDSEPYLPNPVYFSVQDIFFLSVLCQIDPDIKLKNEIIDKLVYTALLVQYNDKLGTNWKWRLGDTTLDDDELSPFILAIKYMPMMKNDRQMLTKGANYIKTYKLKKLKIVPLEKLLENSDKTIEYNSTLAAYDMHCLPNIIIEIQGSLPLSFYDNNVCTTQKIPHYIWESMSKSNVRYTVNFCKDGSNLLGKKDLIIFKKVLREIQEYNYNKEYTLDNAFTELIAKFNNDKHDNDYHTFPTSIGKKAFLTLFGQKIRLRPEKGQHALEIIVAGDLMDKNICKVKRVNNKNNKYLEGDEQIKGQERYIKYMQKENKIYVELLSAPDGYIWHIESNKKKVHIYINKNKFYVNDTKLKLFDARRMLKKIEAPKMYEIPSILKYLICQTLYCTSSTRFGLYEINLINRGLHKMRKKKKDYKIYEWIYLTGLSKLKSNIWRLVVCRLHNGFDNEVFVGPVDRHGNKVNRSINYLNEGIIWRILNLLAALYPAVLQIRGYFKYALNKNAAEYMHLKQCLDKLTLEEKECVKNKNKTKIKIKTKPWIHQQQSTDRIFYGYTVEQKKGFGDASFVGAGKTLTSLTVISKLMNYNNNNNNNNKGVVILLPTTKLYKTWFDEIEKHTEGFDILVQQANGKLESMEKGTIINKEKSISDIKHNTLLITTLGRMRDHPLSNPWILTVIDECLTVQNKEALQTSEAWKQSLCSQYGVLMMSATFFRSRFDKMFYMLSMLRSGLPEKKEYLDAILAEHIVCFIPEKSRVWTNNITKYMLSKKDKINYDTIKGQDIGSEKMYHMLAQYIHTNINYVQLFVRRINELDKDCKILIYCKSKEEADSLSQHKKIGRYPDISKQHVCVSYAEGTYGLNDLVVYDTLLTRPPEPDKLSQMKGRLDRPGQTSDILHLEYIILKNTIEEALLYRLEICNSFYKNHILPLADFYDIAVSS